MRTDLKKEPKSPRGLLWAALVVLLLGAGLWWWNTHGAKTTQRPTHEPAKEQKAQATPVKKEARASGKLPEVASTGRSPEENISASVAHEKNAEAPNKIQVSTYPSVSPELNQEERKKAFGLDQSVDHVVLPREPFTIDGQEWTIEKIRKRLGIDAPRTLKESGEPILHSVTEKPVGSFVKKSLKPEAPKAAPPPGYYGVRLVRPGENLWNIHYHILREYFARRNVRLPRLADEPRPDGTSSGIGKVLKFLENIVYVYNIRENRLVDDLNRLYPNDLIVFFKISDVFASLDTLTPQDLPLLRYTGTTLELTRHEESRTLLDSRRFRAEPPPPPSSLPSDPPPDHN